MGLDWLRTATCSQLSWTPLLIDLGYVFRVLTAGVLAKSLFLAKQLGYAAIYKLSMVVRCC